MKGLLKSRVIVAGLCLLTPPGLFASIGHAPIAGSAESPLPRLGTVLQNALARAKDEDQNERGFQEHYAYKRRKVSEERNGQGTIKKRQQKISQHNPAPAPPPQPHSGPINPAPDHS